MTLHTRARFQARVRERLDTDASVRRFFAGERRELPSFYAERIRGSLGPLWDALPPGALMHDENAYLADPLGKSIGLESARPGGRATRSRLAS